MEENLSIPNTASTEEEAAQDLENELARRAEQGEVGEDIFSEMASAFDDNEEKGLPVSEKLAELFNSQLGSKLPNKNSEISWQHTQCTQSTAPTWRCRRQTRERTVYLLYPYTRKASVGQLSHGWPNPTQGHEGPVHCKLDQRTGLDRSCNKGPCTEEVRYASAPPAS